MEKAEAQNRNSRSMESREKTFARPKAWQLPETLPMPEDRPGWKHRYVRVSMMGQADPQNISAKLREGYEPCRAEDYPELMMHANEDGRFKGCVEIGGLLLCRIPEEFLQQRAEYFARQNKNQMESVDQSYMRENHPLMRKFAERKSEVSFGTGS